MKRNAEPNLEAAEAAADNLACIVNHLVYRCEADGTTGQHGEPSSRLNVYFDLRGETERELRYSLLDQLEHITRTLRRLP